MTVILKALVSNAPLDEGHVFLEFGEDLVQVRPGVPVFKPLRHAVKTQLCNLWRRRCFWTLTAYFKAFQLFFDRVQVRAPVEKVKNVGDFIKFGGEKDDFVVRRHVEGCDLRTHEGISYQLPENMRTCGAAAKYFVNATPAHISNCLWLLFR